MTTYSCSGPADWASRSEFLLSAHVKTLVPLVLLGLCALGTQAVRPETVRLVKNLNDQSEGSRAWGAVQLGCRLVFSANDGVSGRELWTLRSRFESDLDGCSPGGTGAPRLLRDIYPGVASSGAYVVLQQDRQAYFVADDGEHGRELWITDGTRAGTRLVSDLRTGSIGSRPYGFVDLDGEIFFAATDADHGTEVWRSDGTPAGTRLVADLIPGLEGSDPIQLTVALRSVFLLADSAGGQHDLWHIAANGQTTLLLSGIDPTTDRWDPPALVPSGRYVYFSASVDGNESHLWRTDGTAAGTIPVTPPAGTPLSEPSNLFSYRRQLLLSAQTDEFGAELWMTDGTAERTRLVADIQSGPGSSAPRGFFEWKGEVFFGADDGEVGQELWRTNGTTAGTRLVRDVDPIPDYGYGWQEHVFVDLGDKLFFKAPVHDPDDWEPWATDGTYEGTQLLKDINPGRRPSGVFPSEHYLQMDGLVFFPAFDDTHGPEVWVSNGTAEGTYMLGDFRPGRYGGWSYYSTMLAVFDGKVLMTLEDGHYGPEIWESNGTPEGTRLFADLRAEVLQGSRPIPLVAAGPDVYFGPQDFPFELWRSDGSEAGTKRLTDRSGRFAFGVEFKDEIYFKGDLKLDAETGETIFARSREGASPRSAGGYAILNDVLYFKSGSFYSELWRTDGTNEGTYRVKEIVPGSDAALGRSDLVATSDLIFFEADDRIHGSELWRSDGTPEGTFLLKDTAAQVSWPRDRENPAEVTPIGSLVFFVAGRGFNRQLWLSDGSPDGTRPLLPSDAPVSLSYESQLTAVGDTLFFSAIDSDFKLGLWKTDGTLAGTSRVQRIDDAACWDLLNNQLISLTEHQGQLYFGAIDCTHGTELWRSDGTPEGTRMVADVQPGPGSSSPLYITSIGDSVVFSAATAGFGRELWISDGTAEGTRLIADIQPGAESSDPRHFLQAGRQVFFSADDGYHGRELWTLELPGLRNNLEVRVFPPGTGRIDSDPVGIACGSSCQASFLFGRRIELASSAAKGWIFDNWSGDPDCMDGVLRIEGDTACTANFGLCLPDEVLEVEPMTVTDFRRIATCGSIVVAAVDVAPLGTLELEAGGRVAFLDGFSVGPNAELLVANVD